MTPTTPESDLPRDADEPREWLRRGQIRGLAAAALTASLLLGGAFVAVGRLHSSPSDALDHPDAPMDDALSRAQVVRSAQQIAGLGRLHTSSAGYTLMSCKNQQEPPYQGAIYLTFSLPAAARADVYFTGLAAALADHGWRQGLPPNNHPFATTFTRDGVTAVLYRQDDDPAVGIARIYGQCRNMNDHRGDATSWTDITGEFAEAP